MRKPPTCADCAYSRIGEAFCPDLVVPEAPFTVCAQSPGPQEIAAEHPSPLIGPSGFLLDAWVLPAAGFPRGYKYNKMNVLRCHPPGNNYPSGKLRRSAEEKCRQYDVPILPDVWGVSLHPSAVLRDRYDLLPLVVSDFRRAREYLDRGKSVFMMLGGEALEKWAPLPREGVKTWRGHFWGRDIEYPPPVPNAPPMLVNPRRIALDLEWNDRDITAFSVFDGIACWTEERPDEYDIGYLFGILDSAEEIIGHNVLGHHSDIDHLIGAGYRGDIAALILKCRDTMLLFHLLWPQFAGHGCLDLWSMASLYTDLPNWKACRGEGCRGPCPVHEPLQYNILDTVAVFKCYEAMLPELQLRGLI